VDLPHVAGQPPPNGLTLSSACLYCRGPAQTLKACGQVVHVMLGVRSSVNESTMRETVHNSKMLRCMPSAVHIWRCTDTVAAARHCIGAVACAPGCVAKPCASVVCVGCRQSTRPRYREGCVGCARRAMQPVLPSARSTHQRFMPALGLCPSSSTACYCMHDIFDPTRVYNAGSLIGQG